MTKMFGMLDHLDTIQVRPSLQVKVRGQSSRLQEEIVAKMFVVLSGRIIPCTHSARIDKMIVLVLKYKLVLMGLH